MTKVPDSYLDIQTTSIPLTKKCRICKEHLPIDRFWDSYKKETEREVECRLCKKFLKHKRQNIVQPYGYKWCDRCDKYYPLFFFPIAKSTTDGYRHQCKLCTGGNKKSVFRKFKNYNRKNKDDKNKHIAKRPASYSVWADRVLPPDNPQEDDFGNLLVTCKLCNQVFLPTRSQVMARAQSLERDNGYSNFYCSDACKNVCPLYKLKPNIYVNAFNKGMSVEEYNKLLNRDNFVQSFIREKALKRANYACERCGETEGIKAHHIHPVKVARMLSEDIDNIIILCHKCHMKAHSVEGCRLHELRLCTTEVNI